jgi:hypothetical protein
MAVYVDNMRARFGRMVMCHLWADSEEELIAMADRIGVARKWIQRPPSASWLHFDIALSKRALAVRHGAIETDRFGPLEHVARQRTRSGDPDVAALGEKQLDLIVLARRARGAAA